MAFEPWADCHNIADASRAISLGHTHVSLVTRKAFVDQLLRALEGNSTLTALNLSRCLFPPSAVRPLFDGLGKRTSLTVLHLTDCFAQGDTGQSAFEYVHGLAEALKDNTTLTTIHLRRNDIDDDGAQVLANALGVNSTLTCLYLQENLIGSRGGAALAEALRVNASMRSLQLEDNEVGNTGACALAEALKVNCTLSALGLRSNNIGNEGMIAVAETLKVSTSLTFINLAANRVRTPGFLALAEAVRVNGTLEQLIIANGCGREERLARRGAWGTAWGGALADAIARHPTLELLDLSDWYFDSRSLEPFVNALQGNFVLTELLVVGTGENMDEIQTLLHRNRAKRVRRLVLTVCKEGEQLVFRKMSGEEVATFSVEEVQRSSIHSLCSVVARDINMTLDELAFAGSSGISIDAQSSWPVGEALRGWFA